MVIIVIAAVSGGNKTSTSSSNSGSASQMSSNSSPAEESKQKQFVTVVELNGNANKNSDTFELKGGKVKITYTFNGVQSIVGAVYILKEGTDLNQQGGIPEVTVTEAGTDSTFLTKSAGKYYLSVKAANTTWNVKIEEER